MDVKACCCVENSENKYKLEKPLITDEDIEKMPFEEKKWLMIFLIMLLHDKNYLDDIIKKLYHML